MERNGGAAPEEAKVPGRGTLMDEFMDELLAVLRGSERSFRRMVEAQEGLLASQLRVETMLREQLKPRERIVLVMQTTDDYKVSFKAEGFDLDGVSTGLIKGGTATVDNDDVATVKESAENPGSYEVTRKPASAFNTGTVTVVVTVTDPATGKSATANVEFDPGAESSIVLTPTLISLATQAPVVSSDPTPTNPTQIPDEPAPVETANPPIEPTTGAGSTDEGAPVTPSNPTTPDDGTITRPGDETGTEPAGNPGDTPVPDDPTIGDQGSGTSPTQSTGGGPAATDPGTNASTVGEPTTVDPSASTIPAEPDGTTVDDTTVAPSNAASTSA